MELVAKNLYGRVRSISGIRTARSAYMVSSARPFSVFHLLPARRWWSHCHPLPVPQVVGTTISRLDFSGTTRPIKISSADQSPEKVSTFGDIDDRSAAYSDDTLRIFRNISANGIDHLIVWLSCAVTP